MDWDIELLLSKRNKVDCLKKITVNADCLIVLLVGEFKDSKIENIFSNNFINILRASNINDAILLMNVNHLDIVVYDKNSLKNPYGMIEESKQICENILSILVSSHLDTSDLLKSIDLKIDSYLLESYDNKKIFGQLNTILSKYVTLKNSERFGVYFNANKDNVIVSKTNELGIITYVNEEFCTTSGYDHNELIDANHNIVRDPDNQTKIFKQLWHTIKEKKSVWQGIIKNRTKCGQSYYAKSIIIPILDKEKDIIEFIGMRINISNKISDKNRLFSNIESNSLSVLALIQINEYDILKELYSKELIEKVNSIFQKKLLSYFIKEGIFNNIYTLDNGKYAVLCNFYKFMQQNECIEQYFDKVAQEMNNSTFVVDNFDDELNIVLSYSYGKEKLFEDAQQGLENTMFNNKIVCDSNDACIIHQGFKQKKQNTIKMIKVALDNDNIISYFQPIINNKTKKIDKYESLVRLIDENNNIIQPHAFLNIAKESSYYNKITNRVIQNTFRILNKIDTDVTMNISMSDIEKKETRDMFFSLLGENEKDAHRVVIELLEDENVKNFHIIKKFIIEVKSKGVKIAIDDFGSGFSNFDRLLNFEPDIIKIDGTLIKEVEHDSFSRNLVETISSLSKKQNIKTVAEFVENENTFNILEKMGIDYSQGYFFGKPENLDFSFQ